MIDPHVHFKGNKESILEGISLAKDQGIDMVFDMPNIYNHPIINIKGIRDKFKLIPKKLRKHYRVGIIATSNKDQLEVAVKAVLQKRAVGIKMFAGLFEIPNNLGISSTYVQKEVYKNLVDLKYKNALVVACEKKMFISNIFKPELPYSHCLARPKIAEIEAIKDQIRLALETGFEGILHICHVSCSESVYLIKEARNDLRITCSVTPHHIIWDDSKLLKDNGLLYKTNPPLRSKEDVSNLRECLRKGLIDFIESDHNPYSIGEKLHTKYLSGYPSLYLYKDFVKKYLPFKLGLDYNQINKLTFKNIIKTFNI